MHRIIIPYASSFPHAFGGNPENSLDTRLRRYDEKDFYTNGHDRQVTTNDECRARSPNEPKSGPFGERTLHFTVRLLDEGQELAVVNMLKGKMELDEFYEHRW